MILHNDIVTKDKKPVRILQCVIGSMNVGGIETMLMEVYRHIDRTQFQFDFVVHDFNKNAFEDEIVSMGGILYRIPFYSKNPFRHNREFKDLLEKHPEYQIVHIHTTYAIMYSDAKIAKKLKRIVIIHSHNSRATKAHALYHYIHKRSFSKLADYRLSCSYIAGEWMFGNSYPYDIWKNAIRVDKFRFCTERRKQIRKELGIVPDTVLIGNVARLSYQKNQELLLNIYAEYIKKNRNSKLILVGDGEDRSKLKNIVKELNLTEWVIFTGNVSNVNDYLMAMDIFCLTSRWEGFGVSMIEAVTAGVVVVAPALVDELIKQLEHIIIVKRYDNVGFWVEALEKAEPLNESMRYHCYASIKEQGYDIESQVKAVENFYSKLL